MTNETKIEITKSQIDDWIFELASCFHEDGALMIDTDRFVKQVLSEMRALKPVAPASLSQLSLADLCEMYKWYERCYSSDDGLKLEQEFKMILAEIRKRIASAF